MRIASNSFLQCENYIYDFCSRIAERVIAVLRQMQCPYPLQPNQVQGRDFNAIFPVVQWIVAKVGTLFRPLMLAPLAPAAKYWTKSIYVAKTC